jgi:hypothetical protein
VTKLISITTRTQMIHRVYAVMTITIREDTLKDILREMVNKSRIEETEMMITEIGEKEKIVQIGRGKRSIMDLLRLSNSLLLTLQTSKHNSRACYSNYRSLNNSSNNNHKSISAIF